MPDLDIKLPEHLVKRIKKECTRKDMTPSKLVTQILVKEFSLQSPQEKLALLRDLIKTKYGNIT